MIKTPILGFDQICELLPQKPPFIFIDQVLELVKGERILCLKNVSGNDPWFSGHFPSRAIMPGALLIEAMAQAALLLAVHSDFAMGTDAALVMGSVKARFRKPVLPGEQLLISAEIDKMISRGAVISAAATVAETAVVTATMTFGLYE